MRLTLHVKLAFAAAITSCLLASSPRAQAHGEMHELIEQATEEIAKNPTKPELYLKRGQLHRLHRSWDDALADFERAAALTNRLENLHLARAEVFMDVEWFKSAKAAVDRFLEAQPNHAEALLLRARARTKLGQPLDAIKDYDRAIASSPNPSPELYTERAQTWLAAGNEHLQEALQGIEQGITRLGPLVTLQLAAIDIEFKQNRPEAALARIDNAMARLPRKENWLARRAEVLRQLGRSQEAAENYKSALKALDSLPPERRRVPAMAELEQRIRSGLAALGQ